MPFDKWIVKAADNNMSIVLKRNEISGMIIVGGHNTFRTIAEHIIEDGLCAILPENSHSQRGRFRFVVLDVSLQQWRECIRQLEEDFITKRVVSHGRIM